MIALRWIAAGLVLASLAAGTIGDSQPEHPRLRLGGYHAMAAHFHIHSVRLSWAILRPGIRDGGAAAGSGCDCDRGSQPRVGFEKWAAVSRASQKVRWSSPARRSCRRTTTCWPQGSTRLWTGNSRRRTPIRSVSIGPHTTRGPCSTGWSGGPPSHCIREREETRQGILDAIRRGTPQRVEPGRRHPRFAGGRDRRASSPRWIPGRLNACPPR